MKKKFPKKQDGFTLIEVLIAMLILSVILFSFLDIQLAALESNQHALLYSIAIEQLQNMVAFIQQKNISISHFAKNWNEENKELLPYGYGEIEKNQAGYVVRIYWKSLLNYPKRCSVNLSKYACLELQVKK